MYLSACLLLVFMLSLIANKSGHNSCCCYWKQPAYLPHTHTHITVTCLLAFLFAWNEVDIISKGILTLSFTAAAAAVSAFNSGLFSLVKTASNTSGALPPPPPKTCHTCTPFFMCVCVPFVVCVCVISSRTGKQHEKTRNREKDAYRHYKKTRIRCGASWWES